MFNSNTGFSMPVAPIYGNGGSFGGGFGEDLIALIVILAVLNGGFGGFGFGGFGGGAGLQGIATRADINEGFALQNITSGIQGIQQGICDSTYALNNALTSGFSGVQSTLCSGFNGLSREIADCCCQTQGAVKDIRYDLATQACDTRNLIQSTTRDIIDGQNASTRAILDFLTTDKIASLQAENQSLKLAASQSNQNAVLMAAMDANKAEILRRTGAECPSPAYIVNAPTPVTFPVNSCGQFSGYGYNNGGCGCGCN